MSMHLNKRYACGRIAGTVLKRKHKKIEMIEREETCALDILVTLTNNLTFTFS